MFYLADLADKEVFADKTPCGSNAKIVFDNLSRKCFVKADKVLAAEKITVGEKVNIFDPKPVDYCDEEDNCINVMFPLQVGQKIYDTNGKFLGEVENAEFTPKCLLKKLWAENTEFVRRQIFCVGDAVLIKAKSYKQWLMEQACANSSTAAKLAPSAKHKPKIPTADPALPAPTTNGTTAQKTSTSGTFHAHNEPNTATDAAAPTEMGKIRKRYGNFNFLIGKTVDKTIVNFQGEVMIKKSEVVSREILRQAKISGKLLELYLHVD